MLPNEYCVIRTPGALTLINTGGQKPDLSEALILQLGRGKRVVFQPGQWGHIYGPATYADAMEYLNDIDDTAAGAGR